MSRAMMMRGWQAAAVGLLAIGALGCPGGETECKLDTVTFQAPVDGDEVAANTDVVVRGASSSGVEVALEQVRLEYRGPGESDFGHMREGTVVGGTGTFSKVALPVGASALRATAVQKGNATCSKVSAPITVTVLDPTPAPVVSAVVFPQDANSDGVLNSVELAAGTAIEVRATATNAEGGSAQVLDQNDEPLGLAATVTGGVATLSIPATDTGYQSLFVRVTRGSKANTRAGNVTAVASISVNRAVSTCSLVEPAKVLLGVADDADAVKSGYQLRAVASVGEAVTQVKFKLAGGVEPAESPVLAPVSGASSHDFDLPSTGSTLYTLTLEAKDAVGNPCTATKLVTIDFVLPVVEITAPLAAGNPQTTFTVDATANVMGAEGQQVCFYGTGPVVGEVSLGCGTVASGTVAASINFPKNGTWNVLARVSSAAGNQGQGVSNGIIVNSTLCTASLASVRPMLLLGDVDTTGAQPVYTVSATTSCSGAATTLKVNGAEAGAVTATAGGLAVYQLPVSDKRVYGLEFCVANHGLSDPTCATSSAAVALTRPEIVQPTGTAGWLNAAADSSPTTAGVQRALGLTLWVPSGATASMCSDQAPAPAGAADCPDGVSGWWLLQGGVGESEPAFTFPNGEYQVKAVVALGGVANVSVPLAVRADAVLPVVAVTAPGAGATVSTYTMTALATVTHPASLADGQQLCFFGTSPAVTGEQSLGCATVQAGGQVTASISFPRLGTWSVFGRVTTTSGNAGEGSSTGVVVNYALCTASALVPSMITSSVTTGTSPVNFPYAANSSCRGVATSLVVNGGAAQAGTTDAATGNVLYTVPVVDETSYTFRLCITNVGLNDPTCVDQASLTRLVKPTLALPGFAGTWLNVAQDGDAVAAGVQRELATTASVPPSGSLSICSNQSPRPVGYTDTTAFPPCADGAGGWWQLKASPAASEAGFTFPDGSYSLKAVVKLGSSFNVSTALAVNVDSKRPCVAAGSLSSMGDTSPKDGWLSAAERASAPGGNPRLAFTLGCDDTASTISSVVVKASSAAACAGTPTVFSVYPANATISGASGVVAMSQNVVTSTEASPVLGVELVDLAGNTNVLCGASGVDTAALLPLAFDFTPPAVAPGSLAVVQDATPKDGNLNAAELATNAGVAQVSFQLAGGEAAASLKSVTVKSVEDCQAAATTYGTGATWAGATATASLSSLATAGVEQRFGVAVELEDLAGNKNVVCGASGSGRDEAAIASVFVDTVSPACAIAVPAENAQFNLAQDLSGDANFQLATRIDTSGDVATGGGVVGGATGAVGGAAGISLGVGTVSGNSISNVMTVPGGVRDTFTGTATCTDASGNATNAAARTFVVDTVVPAIAPVAFPSPVPSFSYVEGATVTGAGTAGQTIFYYGTATTVPRTLLGSSVIAVGGASSTTLSFPKNETYAIDIEVTSAAGNFGRVTVSGVVVSSAFCTATPSVPGLIVASMVTGGNYTVAATTSCFNQPVSLRVNGGAANNSTSNGSGQASFAVPVADGAYSFQFCVSNAPSLEPDTCTTVSTVVQLSPPTLAAFGSMPLNVAQDLDGVTAGVQRPVSFTAAVPSGGSASLCATLTPAPGGSQACPDGAAGWVLHSLTQDELTAQAVASVGFPDGAYDVRLVVNVGGATGVSNVSAPVSVTADSVRPCALAVTLPQDANSDLDLNLTELAGGAPQVRVVLDPSCGDSSVAAVRVRPVEACANSRAPFNSVTALSFSGSAATASLDTGVTATEADYEWGVELTDAAGNTNVVCGAPGSGRNEPAIIAVRVDKQAPTCTAAAVGASFNQFQDADGLTAGFQLDTSVTTSADVDDAAVQRAMSPGAGVSFTDAARSGDVLARRYTLPATPGSIAYELTGSCTDRSGNSTSATTRNFSVDMTLCPVTPNVPQYITRLMASGGNYTFRANSSVACAGQAVTLARDGSDLPPATTVDGAGAITFAPRAVTDGTYTFRFCVANFGATAASCADATATVQLSSPIITAPLTMPLNVSRDTQPGTAGMQAALSYSATPPVGATFHVCSNQTSRPVGYEAAAACPDTTEAGWWVLKDSPTNGDTSFTWPEGSYDVKLVMMVGTAPNPSAPLAVVVDSVRPCMASVSLPQDGNGDSRLSIAELAAAPGVPQVGFTLGCSDTAATIKSVAVKAVVGCGNSTTTFTNGAPDIALVGSSGTATLSQNMTSTEFDYDLAIELTDLRDNTNVICTGGTTAIDAAARKLFRVDRQVPSCSVTKPDRALYGLADDADGAAGFQLLLQADTSADVADDAVSFTVTGESATLGTAGRVSNSVQRVATLAAAGTTTLSVGATCTDASGNQTTATTVTGRVVDRDPPTCAMTAPATGSLFSSFQQNTSVTAGGAEGRTVTISSTAGGQVGTLTVTGGVASGSLTYSGGVQTATASVTDAAGNNCSATSNFEIRADGCSLSATAPTGTLINTLNSTPAGAGTATVALAANTSTAACQNGVGQVSLYRTLPGPRTLVSGPTGTNAAGNVSVSVSVTDGTTVQYEWVIDNGAGVTTTVATSAMTVDISPPAVASVSPNAANVYIVASSNKNLSTNGYVVDGTPGSAPGDFNVTLTGVTGANGGTARVKVNGSEVASASVSSDPAASIVLPVSLAQNTTGPLLVEVVDANSNVLTALTATIEVDVIPPGAPTMDATFPKVTDTRRATVQLSFDPTYDDGASSGSGGHTGYEVRWTTGNVTGANNLATEADYADSNKAYRESNVAWSASKLTPSFTLPPMNTYYIVARAVDNVGNYSDYPVGAVPTVTNGGNVISLANPTGVANQSYGSSLAVGRINDDAYGDFVVGASQSSSNVGAVYVYWGRSNPSTIGGTCAAGDATNCQEIVPYEAVSSYFGTAVAVGDVGGSSSRADIVVGAPRWAGGGTNTGRAFLYFGPSAAGTAIATSGVDDFVEFRGRASGVRLGDAVQMIDVNADGILDVVISASGDSASGTDTGQGRVFVFKGGRTTDQWRALRTATDTTQTPNRSYVPVSHTTADWTIDGPLPVNTTTPTQNFFGYTRRSLVALGDLGSTGKTHIGVAAVKFNIGKLWAFSSDSMTVGAAPLSTATPAFRLDGPTSASGLFYGFGSVMFGTAELGGGQGRDLVVSQPAAKTVYVYESGTPTGFGSSSVSFVGTDTYFGNQLAVGQLNDSGAGPADIVIGSGAANGVSVWVFYARPSGGYDNQLGVGFWQSKHPSTTKLGLSVAVADVSGDGKDDLLMTDDTSGNGRIVIWY